MECVTKASEMCHLCQDFELNVGHETKWCPNSSCKNCGQTGHTKIGCMFGLENLPLPDETVLKVRLSQNDFMKSSILQNSNRKI